MRFIGQWSMQPPQRMHAVGVTGRASFSLNARMALVPLATGASRSYWATPIIGPPMTSFFGSQEKPPAKSMTSLQAVPMGAMTFFGSLMAEPSTVMHFSTSGMPVVQ